MPSTKDYQDAPIVSIKQFIERLETAEDIDIASLNTLRDSNINTENNREFERLIKKWEKGHFDDYPDEFNNQLIELVNGNS
jgi:hypothetical protein